MQGFPHQARCPGGSTPPSHCPMAISIAGWLGAPRPPEQHWQLGSHMSAQSTTSTRKLRASKITTFPTVPLGVFQHKVAQCSSVPRLSHTVQYFQIFGSFQPVSLFISVSNCCGVLLRAKLSCSQEPLTCPASAAWGFWRVSGCMGH